VAFFEGSMRAAYPKPDARALVERYSGWSKVPVDEWIKLSRAIVSWRRKNRPLLAIVATTAIGVGVER
jgi:hypothetical protein